MTGRSVVAGALARWLLRVSGKDGVSNWVRSAARVGLRTARFTSVGSSMSATYSR